MDVFGPLLGVAVGAVLMWFLTKEIRRDDRRRDAWAGWAEQAYGLMVTRRELVERRWSEQSDQSLGGGASFSERVSRDLVREIARDAQLHSALARVLLSEPSRIRRDQARAFTGLLSEDVELALGADQNAFLRSHDRYLRALQATLDHLLGMYAEAGTTMQVSKWFNEKYDELTSKTPEIEILHVDDDAPEGGRGAA